jgi:hypothetical protein
VMWPNRSSAIVVDRQLQDENRNYGPVRCRLATHTADNIFAAIELSSTAWVSINLPTKDSLARVTCGDVDRLLEMLERFRTTTRARSDRSADPYLL